MAGFSSRYADCHATNTDKRLQLEKALSLVHDRIAEFRRVYESLNDRVVGFTSDTLHSLEQLRDQMEIIRRWKKKLSEINQKELEKLHEDGTVQMFNKNGTARMFLLRQTIMTLTHLQHIAKEFQTLVESYEEVCILKK